MVNNKSRSLLKHIIRNERNVKESSVAFGAKELCSEPKTKHTFVDSSNFQQQYVS